MTWICEYACFFCLSNQVQFVSWLNMLLVSVDIISAIEFDKSGDHLATGDRGGPVVLFERSDARDVSITLSLWSWITVICVSPPDHHHRPSLWLISLHVLLHAKFLEDLMIQHRPLKLKVYNKTHGNHIMAVYYVFILCGRLLDTKRWQFFTFQLCMLTTKYNLSTEVWLLCSKIRFMCTIWK